MDQSISGIKYSPLDTLIDLFRSRASRLRVQSYMILGTISTLLIAAVWIFFAAADITKQDAKLVSTFKNSSEVKAEIDAATKRIPPEPKITPTPAQEKTFAQYTARVEELQESVLNRFKEINENIVNRIAKKEAVIDRGNFNARSITNYTDTEMPSSLISDEKFYFLDEWPTDSVSDFKNLAGLSADLKNFIAKIDLEVPQIADKAKSLRNELQTLHSAKHRKWEQETLPLQQKIKDLQAGLKSVEEQEFSQKYGNKDKSDSPELSIPFLVQTNITRFGPMIIMFFFCSILVNLYRYHQRLSAYYDARAERYEG